MKKGRADVDDQAWRKWLLAISHSVFITLVTLTSPQFTSQISSNKVPSCICSIRFTLYPSPSHDLNQCCRPTERRYICTLQKRHARSRCRCAIDVIGCCCCWPVHSTPLAYRIGISRQRVTRQTKPFTAPSTAVGFICRLFVSNNLWRKKLDHLKNIKAQSLASWRVS